MRLHCVTARAVGKRTRTTVRRFANYVRLIRRLHSGGVRSGSMITFPIRRRISGVNQIRLKNGVTLSSPASEPLLHLFQEIFVDQHYAMECLNLSANATVVEIGAHVGVFTAWISTI